MLGLCELGRHAEKHEDFMRERDGSAMYIEGEPWKTVEWSTHAELWQKFDEEWRLQDSIGLNFLFRRTGDPCS